MQALKMDQKFKELVKSERKITHEILLMIQAFDITKSFRELGYSSLFEYLTKEVGYSESAAQRRISSARFMKECPEIETDLKSGNLNLTQISLAQMAIRQEEKAKAKGGLQKEKISMEQKRQIISKLKNKNSLETKKLLKKELPSFELPMAKINPSSDNKIHVTLEFSEKDWEAVQKLMAKMSHKVPNQKLEDLLLYWHQQIQKKEAAAKDVYGDGSPSQNRLGPEKDKASKNPLPLRQWKASRKYISVNIKQKLMREGQGKCQYISPLTGKACDSAHFLEIEHIHPLALGGSHQIANLRIFCRAHNQLAAKEWGILK